MEKENSPKIKIEIEKGYLIVSLYIDNEEWDLCSLYKYLHHNEIVKSTYGNAKSIELYFEKYTRKYLDEVLANLMSYYEYDMKKLPDSKKLSNANNWGYFYEELMK